jgi:hypothetical protein
MELARSEAFELVVLLEECHPALAAAGSLPLAFAVEEALALLVGRLYPEDETEEET